MTRGIYTYIDKKNNEIVYIGKDSNIDTNERHKQHFQPSKYDNQPINRILQNNRDRYIYQVLWEIDDCTNNHLNQMEIYYIKKYNPQFNFTEGGDGISGYRHTEKSKGKISESLKGKTFSEETKKKISESLKGKTFSEETKKKMSEAKKGKTLSEETKKKISESLKGKTFSEETKKKMSEARKGKTFSEETKKKISESLKGKTHSLETRKKISESQNTTGFYRVLKKKDNNCKQGFVWCYQYYDNNKRKSISSTDLKKLEKKVKKEELEWEIIDKENSIKSIQQNDNRF